MALIHILDKQSDRIIGTLNLGEYSDSGSNEGKVSSSENENTFDFTALKKFDLLQKRNRLLLQDKDGFFSEYIIIYAEQNSRNQKFIKSNATFTDLRKAKIIEPQVLQGATADTATTKALEGTEWRKGKVDYNGIRTLKIEEYTNPYRMLKKIASEFGLDLRFRIAVEGNKIVRYVDLTLPDDEFDGKEVVFGKDLVGLRRIEDAQNIVTALLVLGPEQEDGTRLTVLVEDNDALQRWGRNGQHLIEVYEPQITAEEVTVERLRTLGQNALQKRIDAIVTYECQAAIMEHIPGKEHEKVRLDRTIRIKDEGYTPPLYLEAKVLEVKEQPSTGKILDFKLGNYKEYSKADLEAQIAGLKKLLAQKASNAKLVETYELALQQAEEKAAQAEENAKGYTDTVKVEVVEHANTVANQAENNAKEHADTVAGEAESNAKAYALSEADKARIAAIQAAATDAQTKVNAAKTALEADIATKVDAQWVNGQLQLKADNTAVQDLQNEVTQKADVTWVNNQLVLKENAIHRGTTAPTDTTKLWLDTSVVPNVLKRYDSATSSWVKATPTSAREVGAYTKTEVDNALNSKVSVTTYTADKNGIISRLDSAESRITQNEQEIATKVSQTDYDALEGRVSQAESSIIQNANAIQSKVSQTDFNVLSGRVSTAESTITQHANLIEQKVNQTDYNGNTIASLINQTATTIKLQAAKIALDGYVEAKHIKSLNGLNVGNGQFVVDANGNVKFAGDLNGAGGSFKGSLETGRLVIGPESPDISNFDDGMQVIELKMPERVSEDVYTWRDPVNIKLLNGDVIFDGQTSFLVNSSFSAKDIHADALNIKELHFDSDPSSVYFDILGNIKAPSTASDDALWHMDDKFGNIVFGVHFGKQAPFTPIFFRPGGYPETIELMNLGNAHLGIRGNSSMLKFPAYTAELWSVGADGVTWVRHVAKDFYSASSRTIKKDIEPFTDSEDALPLIRQTTVYKYRHKDDTPDEPFKAGLILEESPAIIQGDNGISVYGMSSLLWEGVKELDETQRNIIDRVSWLETENSYLKQKIAILEAKIS